MIVFNNNVEEGSALPHQGAAATATAVTSARSDVDAVGGLFDYNTKNGNLTVRESGYMLKIEGWWKVWETRLKLYDFMYNIVYAYVRYISLYLSLFLSLSHIYLHLYMSF